MTRVTSTEWFIGEIARKLVYEAVPFKVTPLLGKRLRIDVGDGDGDALQRALAGTGRFRREISE